jgi:hypothetical protein
MLYTDTRFLLPAARFLIFRILPFLLPLLLPFLLPLLVAVLQDESVYTRRNLQGGKGSGVGFDLSPCTVRCSPLTAKPGLDLVSHHSRFTAKRSALEENAESEKGKH